jgi:hypothetical protein
MPEIKEVKAHSEEETADYFKYLAPESDAAIQLELWKLAMGLEEYLPPSKPVQNSFDWLMGENENEE